MSSTGGQPELLVVAKAEPTMASLVSALADRGVASDVVHALGAARESFLASGGHTALVLAPDLPPSLARELIDSLTSVDPDLPVVAFGEDHTLQRNHHAHVRRISYHPSSRAAVGAVLKAVHDA